MSFALKYRPANFSQVTGQSHVTGVLYRMVRRGTVPPALLLAGVRGTGKTSTARILAAAMHCESENQAAGCWPCGQCPECTAVAAGHSLAVLEVDAASSGGVEAIRDLRQLAAYGRLILLDEAHSLSRDGFNALLKVMEEPPPGSTFVLLTTEPGRILPTVVSRCMTFVFRPLQPEAIAGRLAEICQAEGIGAGPELLAAIASRADGAMRDAVMLLDQAVSALPPGKLSLASFQALFGDPDVAPPIVAAMAAGDYPAMYAAVDLALAQAGDPSSVIGKLAGCLADLLRLRSGGAIAAQGVPLEDRRKLAAQLDVPRLTGAMKVLWDWQTRIRVEDRRAGLTLACVVAAEKLCPVPVMQVSVPVSVNGNGNGHRETGLDALRQALGAI
jgi:DNA polymerase III subunit gamma/tau